MKRTIALGCFVGAGIAAAIGAVGATLTSVPAIHGQLALDPDPYWNDRLLASLILSWPSASAWTGWRKAS